MVTIISNRIQIIYQCGVSKLLLNEAFPSITNKFYFFIQFFKNFTFCNYTLLRKNLINQRFFIIACLNSQITFIYFNPADFNSKQ